MISVCADPCSMAPDDRGVMRLRIAGDPDTLEWPYDCSIADSNNLRRDASGCLWVDPRGKNLVTAVTGEFFPGASLGGTATITNVANLTITNPDPCRPAAALVTVLLSWTLDADFDPASTFGGFILSRQVSGDPLPADGGFVEVIRNHIGSRTTAVESTRTSFVIPAIAAGGTAQVNLDMRAANFSGNMIWTRAQGTITALVTTG